MGSERDESLRPFLGQRHTFYGERGRAVIEGVRLRDLCDMIARAFIECSGSGPDDKTIEEINVSLYHTDLDLDSIDPVGFMQNVCVKIEKKMGTFPNVPTLRSH